MKLGAEPKKVAMLAGLVVVGGVVFYMNVLSGPDSGSPSGSKGGPAVRLGLGSGTPAPPASPPPPPNIRRARAMSSKGGEAVQYTMKTPEKDRPDPTKYDPTLRLDLLAKVQEVQLMPGRNIFQFGAAPPPPKTPEQLAQAKIPIGPRVAEPPKTAVTPSEPVKPQPPPITLKFYGFSTPKGDGQKRAFFLDGEDIFIASEGELIKKRYKVVRIGVNSVVMEDTEHKNQQTIILQQEQVG